MDAIRDMMRHPDMRRKVDVATYRAAYPLAAEYVDSKRSGGSMIYHLIYYSNWRASQGLDPDPASWVAECRAGNNNTLAEHSEAVERWANGPELDGRSETTKEKYVSSVRSLYLYKKLKLPPVVVNRKEDPYMVKEEVSATAFLEMAEKVVNRGGLDPRDRSVIVTALQSAMDESTLTRVFNFVAFPQLTKFYGTEDWRLWDPSRAPVRVDLVRPKTSYRYYTFLGYDAILCLKDWLDARAARLGRVKIRPSSKPGEMPRSDPIYVSKYGEPMVPSAVSVIFRSAGKEAGINLEPEEMPPRGKTASIRYPFHAHQVRDTLITLRQRVHVDRAVVDFFAGHKFDADGYDSPWDNPELFREEYAKLMPFVNVVTGREQAVRMELEKKFESRLAGLEERLVRYERAS